MAQISVQQQKGQFGNNPYGNMTALIFTLQVDNKGWVVGSNHNQALEAGDVIHIGTLPMGFMPMGYRMYVDKPFNGGGVDFTLSYADGVDDDSYPLSERSAFHSTQQLSVNGDEGSGALTCRILPKDVHLNAVATNPIPKGEKAGHLTVVVFGVLTGHS